MSHCASCGATIDPARAPVARIRNARIVTFCSTECADRPATEVAPAGERAAAPKRAVRRAATQAPAEARKPAPARRATTVADAAPIEHSADAFPRSRRRPKIATAAALVVLGGVAAFAFWLSQTGSQASANAAAPSPRGEVASAGVVDAGAGPAGSASRKPPGPDAAPVLDPHTLEAAATAVLEELLQADSPRVRHLAAMALARTGHRGAIKALWQRLSRSDSELLQIDAAYALARAGDERGTRALVDALDSDRRDVRLDAARALALLGSDAGRKTLGSMLRLRRHRLGAAAVLARLGDREGIDILRRELRSDSDEQAMRAAVALGRAGDASVKERLAAILEGGKYQVGAADALAALGDTRAVKVLARQLASPSLRVQAAEALAKLDAEVDLAPLAAGLQSPDPATRASAAEAVLVLVMGAGEDG